MRIFISWSGNNSHNAAEALREWLPLLFQIIEPWLSSSDIMAGTRWANELAENLDEIDFGILCLTQDNVNSPWIMFEAGALSKSLKKGRIVPYLIGVNPKDLNESPLSQFQCVASDKIGIKKLIVSIAESLERNVRTLPALEKVFEKWWPELKEKLKKISTGYQPIANAIEAKIQPDVKSSKLFESDGILWGIKEVGGASIFSPHCPDCGSPLSRTADFVECTKCSSQDIVSARQPSKAP
jgi:hypothetical protein